MDVREAGEQRHPSSAPSRPGTQSTHTITLMNMACCCCCLLLRVFLGGVFFILLLPNSFLVRTERRLAELSEINNFEFLVHPSLVRAEPSETGRGSRYTQIGTHGKEEREIQIRER